jgi:phosphoribosyl-AMP cyclohydrolase
MPAAPPLVAAMAKDLETTAVLTPRYGADGLITAVVTHSGTGELLMVAHMNAEALATTLATREATFWSRSRQALWRKGETSGHVLKVEEVRIDCDQDAIWLIAEPQGPTCHTGAVSCFYRRIQADGSLERIG